MVIRERHEGLNEAGDIFCRLLPGFRFSDISRFRLTFTNCVSHRLSSETCGNREAEVHLTHTLYLEQASVTSMFGFWNELVTLKEAWMARKY